MAPPYRISMSPIFSAQVRDLSKSAHAHGKLTELIAALESVRTILASAPRESGDPLFTYRQMRVAMRQVVRNHYWFLYGVHLDRAVVFLEGIKPMVDF